MTVDPVNPRAAFAIAAAPPLELEADAVGLLVGGFVPDELVAVGDLEGVAVMAPLKVGVADGELDGILSGPLRLSACENPEDKFATVDRLDSPAEVSPEARGEAVAETA